MRMLGLWTGLMLLAMSALLLIVFMAGGGLAVFRVTIIGGALQMAPVLIPLVLGLILISVSRRRRA